MRIVQTFWSGAADPMEKSYGWPHAEYNLMSWALSCCSLREHFDEVVLYTDQRGYEVLIEKLHLPYTEVYIVYDDNLCLPQHWAYAKIKTYSLQTKPFLHIDGDIYVPKPIPKRILRAPLIAQNREIGTIYYAEMFENIIKSRSIIFPRDIACGMTKGLVSSYNMGFFGGSDLTFINEFCKDAFEFMTLNDMNNPQKKHSSVNCNIFMEQVLFATKCELANREVTSIHPNPVEDKGYSINEFCDLCHYESHDFLHILGGHKQDPYMYEKLEKTLLSKYPYYYLKIMSLYPKRHARLSTAPKLKEGMMKTEYCIAQYEDFIEKCANRWSNVPLEFIVKIETLIAKGNRFFTQNAQNRDTWSITLNPRFATFNIPRTWPETAQRIIKNRLSPNAGGRTACMIIAIPVLFKSGINEVSISDLGFNIISLLKKGETTYKDLRITLKNTFSPNMRESASSYIEEELKYLLFNNIIIISQQE